MASFCPTEVDHIPLDTCPFNPSHHLSDLPRFLTHLKKCKEQFFHGVTVQECPFNSHHLFTSVERLKYHEGRCENHPERRPGGMYQVCPFSNFHRVAVTRDERENRQNMETHVRYCNKRSEGAARSTGRVTQIEEASVGTIVPVSDVRIDSDLANRLSSECVILHFRGQVFSARFLKMQSSLVLEKHYFLDASLHHSSDQFPGLKKLTQTGSHKNYLAARLKPETSNSFNARAFQELYGWFEENTMFKMAICYQKCSITDVIWVVVHPDETSGFGAKLDKGEFGLFALRHSEMLNMPSTLEEMSNRIELLEVKLRAKETELTDRSKVAADIVCEANKRYSDMLNHQTRLENELERMQNELTMKKSQLTMQIRRQSEEQLRPQIPDLQAKQFVSQIKLLNTDKATLTEKLKFSEMQLKDAEMDRDKAQYNLAFLQKQYENSMKKAQGEISRFTSSRSALTNQLGEYKVKIEKLTQHVKLLETTIAALKQRRPSPPRKPVSTILTVTPKVETPPIKRDRDMESVYTMCRECGSNRKNTLNVPCGHMYYCNMCLETRKVVVGRSLKFMETEDKVCKICGKEVKKIVLAYPFQLA